ncbi:MAG: type II secretion system protein [Myxococcales bacterium]|nr:type II secretion system protein [Myxococcales bacterium]MCB9704254.1 type II secretion system protein [Myxococcales bacterium]
MAPRRAGYGEGGFTLLEVMIAVGILGVSMTSLLTSQMASIRATRYAQAITSVAFLAEYQLIEVEWRMQKDGGWVREDRHYEGNFSDQGWPEVSYDCLVDFIEIPDYSKIRAAKDAKARDTDGRTGTQYKTAGDQAFSALAIVWPMVKAAIENSIRKTTCKVHWEEGPRKHELKVSTFWTDPDKLNTIPKLGGEALPGEEEGGGQAGGGASGAGGSASTATGPAGQAARGMEMGGMRK